MSKENSQNVTRLKNIPQNTEKPYTPDMTELKSYQAYSNLRHGHAKHNGSEKANACSVFFFPMGMKLITGASKVGTIAQTTLQSKGI